MSGVHWTDIKTDVNETKLQISCPTKKGGTGTLSRYLVCAKDVNALFIENSIRKLVKSSLVLSDVTKATSTIVV